MIEAIIAALVGAVLGVGGATVVTQRKNASEAKEAEKALKEATNKASKIVLDAKDESLKIAEEAKRDEQSRRKEIKKIEERIIDRETNLDRKLEELDRRSEKLRKREDDVESLKTEIREIRTRQQEKLEKVAKLSKKDAADKLMKMTERDIKQDLLGLVAKLQADTQADAEEKAQTILLTAMERMSSEVTAERTVTALWLLDDDM